MDEANQSDFEHMQPFDRDSLAADYNNEEKPPTNSSIFQLKALPLLPSEAYASEKKNTKKRNKEIYSGMGGFIMPSPVNSFKGQSQKKVKQVQEVITMVSQKEIGHGGKIISGLYRDDSVSRNDGSESVKSLRS